MVLAPVRVRGGRLLEVKPKGWENMATWTDLDTRHGQLLEMAAATRGAANTVRALRRDDPLEHPVGDLLDAALERLERAEYELLWAADNRA
jgi:hypothetical protein